MDISELHSQGIVETGTQMADYPTVLLVGCQVLIFRLGQGSDSQTLQCQIFGGLASRVKEDAWSAFGQGLP